MNIYSFPTFNLTKILLTAEETRQPYQLHLLDFTQGEHKTPEHIKRHPLGKVPAIELSGDYFFESNSICRLLCEKADNQLYGDSPEQRAVINQWADMATMHLGRWLTVLFFENKLKPALFEGETNPSAVDEAETFLSQQLPAVDAQLANYAFLAGDKLSLADIIAFSYFLTIPYSGFVINEYPNLFRWYEAMQARPSYLAAMERMPGNEMFAMLNS